MYRLTMALLTATLFWGPAFAQQAPPTGSTAPSAQTGSSAPRIAAGSVIPVELVKTVDAKKAKSGDEVKVKVTENLRNRAGTVLVPKDTEIIGHVTQAQAHNKDQKESELAISFDKAVLKGGETMQMPMSIQAVIAPPKQDANMSAQNSQPMSSYPSGSSPGSAGPGNPGQGASQGSMGGNQSMPMPAPDNNSAPKAQSQPPITGNTQGVIGIQDLTLAGESNAQQGSLLSSDKSNVKLEGGTFMLLKVNQ